MATTILTINHKKFPIECADGQEETLLEIASQLDKKIQNIRGAMNIGGVANVSMELLLLISALQTQDEVNTLTRARQEMPIINDEVLVSTLEKVSTYMDSITHKISS